MLTAEGIGLRLGQRALVDGVSLAVDAGRTLAVLGPSGSGKTTLLRLVAGLVAPTAGTVAWGAEVLSKGGAVVVPPERRGVALLFQEGVLFPHLDVRENVALGVPPRTPTAAARARVDEALAAARIASLAAARPATLSGGEAQRVALARALAQEARVLLLDEPFHSLDGPVRAEVVADTRRLVRERGLAAIVVTHDVDEAAALADEVIVLRAGRVVQAGTLDAIERAPADEGVARLLGPVVEVDAAAAKAAGYELADDAPATGARVRARVRAPLPRPPGEPPR
jgi:iron(III) transport system ATP-binding protein